MVRNIWVGHAVAEYVHVNEDKNVQLKFLVQHTNADPPQDLLNAGKTGKPCTVEFLTKLLPDRYSYSQFYLSEKNDQRFIGRLTVTNNFSHVRN